MSRTTPPAPTAENGAAGEQIPSPRMPAEKTSLSRLSHLASVSYPDGELSKTEAQRISFTRDGLRHDMLWSPAADPAHAHRLFVIFSGSVDRIRLTLPVFHRWSWAPRFPGNCLFVADASLWQDDALALAWYCGNARVDPMDMIVATVRDIAARLDIRPADIFGYGSSAGGFTALRMATALEGMGVVAINPQTNILKYHRRHVERFLDACLDGILPEEAATRFGARLDLLRHVPQFRQSRIIYIQNRLDPHHVRFHFKPFCKAMGVAAEPCDTGRFRRFMFEDAAGHGAPEPQDLFRQAMDIIANDADWA